MPLPAFVVPVAAILGVGALLFRNKLKAAGHEINNDTQRVAANLRNATTQALAPKNTPEQARAIIAQAIAAGGVHSAAGQPGDVIFSTFDQAAMLKDLPPAFAAILSGPGEPASQETINSLKIDLAAGLGPNPATTLKTTKGGSLFDISPLPTQNVKDTDMVGLKKGDLLVVDMTTAGMGGPGSTAFMVLSPPDMASNTILAETVDPRVPAGTVLDLPFAAINGMEIH